MTGESVPVQEPALLDRLFHRGLQASGRAEHFARSSAARSRDSPALRVRFQSTVAVAPAPIGRVTDEISSRLLVSSMRVAIEQAAARLPAGAEPDHVETRLQQDAYTALSQFEERRHFLAGGNLKYVCRSTWLV